MANTILIMSDEHNPLFSSPYGHPFVRTPNMQRMADSGTLFRNAYCPSPLCMPSRSAMMAGKRVHEIQCYSNCIVDVDPGPPSYGKVLHDQGIHTVYLGKTDVYAPGDQLGFTEMILPHDRNLPGDRNNLRNPVPVRPDADKRANGFGPHPEAGKRDLETIDAAEKWIRKIGASMEKPWHMTLNISAPHFPHVCTQEQWDSYSGHEDAPEFGADEESARHPYAEDLRRHFQTGAFDENQVKGLRRGYYARVTGVDEYLGRILQTLDDTALLGQTNVIYTADHGEMLGKFGMWWKCSMYEDSVRIPLIAMGPDFPTGHVVQIPVDLLDLQSTLFSLLGATRPDERGGTFLRELDENDTDRPVFSEYHGHGTHGSAYMIRKGPWKYIHCTHAPHQLFHLENDPNELKNLLLDRQDIARDMQIELSEFCDPEREYSRAESFIQSQHENMQRLKL